MKCPWKVSDPLVQKALDDLYIRFSQLETASKNLTAPGSPSGRLYTISVDDTTITSPTVVAKR